MRYSRRELWLLAIGAMLAVATAFEGLRRDEVWLLPGSALLFLLLAANVDARRLQRRPAPSTTKLIASALSHEITKQVPVATPATPAAQVQVPPSPPAAPCRTEAALARDVDKLIKWTRAQEVQRSLDLQSVEALLQVYRVLDPPGVMPLSGRWAMDPIGLLALLQMVVREQPKTVVELGSGTSSVWLALVLSRMHGRLITYEAEEAYAATTRRNLAELKLDGVVELRVAPLEDVAVRGRRFTWYRPSAFDDLTRIDLLIVDGPPAETGREARYPAVPMLFDRLAPGARVLLDDSHRPDEKQVVSAWQTTYPSLVLEAGGGPYDRYVVLRKAQEEEETAPDRGLLSPEEAHKALNDLVGGGEHVRVQNERLA